LFEARWLERTNLHVISWDRVGFGLALSVAAYVLLVGDLGRRYLRQLRLPPPPTSRRF
jgi:hypothetical protein